MHTPLNKNGAAERRIGILLQKVRALLIDGSLLNCFGLQLSITPLGWSISCHQNPMMDRLPYYESSTHILRFATSKLSDVLHSCTFKRRHVFPNSILSPSKLC